LKRKLVNLLEAKVDWNDIDAAAIFVIKRHAIKEIKGGQCHFSYKLKHQIDYFMHRHH
jgi:hypothetical protein